ncbi:MAG: hypothetical protein IKS18_03215 [Lachnospiraceae bacterium]|nr:hypothetical protein [Lachnospiraceae bacterium]
MKRKTTKRRRISRFAAAAALIIIFSAFFPLTNVFADYTIDDSAFQNIADSMESVTVYVWHKGKPPITVDGTPYPVLMYWDNGNKYVDVGYGNQGGKIHGTNVGDYTLIGMIGRYQQEGQRAQKKDESDDRQEVGWTCIWMLPWREYGWKNNSSLPLDLTVFHKYGAGISFELPNVPYFIATVGDKQTQEESYYAIEISHGSNYTNPGFLTSMLSCYNYVHEDLIGRDRENNRSFDWLLDVFYSDRKDFIQNKKITRKYYYDDGNGTYESSLKDRTWDVRLEKSGRYTFRQEGVTLDRKEDSESDSWWLYTSYGLLPDALKSWKCHMELHHTEKWGFRSHGWTEKGTGDADFSVSKAYINANGGYDSEDWAFDLAYATTMPMSFVKGDFTVRNGQTVNLDGPMGINKNVTITVEDGGVLTVSGWVVNNGTIKVKQGGTLMLMETAENKGVLTTFNSTRNESAGAILCDGTIINMPGCKLHAGGSKGLRLGSSAQVVNYGAIIAGNLTVNNDYTIENRGDSSVLLAGYDITDGGYVLTAADITVNGSTPDYPGKGWVQLSYNVTTARNYVYGAGVERAYTAKPSSFSYVDVTVKRLAAKTDVYYTK